MTQQFSLGMHTYNSLMIPIVGKVNKRAKRLLLKYDPRKRSFLVTLPSRAYLDQARQLVYNSQSWLTKQAEAFSLISTLGPPPQKLTIFGNTISLLFQEKKRPHIWFDNSTLFIVGSPDKHKDSLIHWIKSQCLAYFTKCCQEYSSLIQENIKTIDIKDRKTAWGTCSNKGNLTFSWRLALAPPAIADYVCAHEVAHLRHMNHSPDFWRLVAYLCTDYKIHRHWLKKHGHTLFQFI